MGDNETPTRTSAHECSYFVISQCQRYDDLASEVYCQLLNQLTSNPDKESMERGLQFLLVLAVSVLPDEELMDYVIAFVKRLEDSRDYGSLAQESMSRLRWASGSKLSLRKMPPSVSELKALQKIFTLHAKVGNDLRVPVTVVSPNGQLHPISCTYYTKITDPALMSTLAEKFLVPHEYSREFSIFVEYKDEEVIVNDAAYLLDVISFYDVKSVATLNYYNLVYKRRLWLSKPEEALGNPTLLDFVFHQLKTSFLDGFLPVSQKDVAHAASLLFVALQLDHDCTLE